MNQSLAMDRISDLPWDILDNILGRLLIKDAVRTTILSRKWRDKWVDLSKLVFDDCSKGTDFQDWDELAKLVYHVLLSHRGQIEKFMLSTQSIHVNRDLDDWILLLSKCDIKELILNLNFRCELPTCLFSCKQLRCLSINMCLMIGPHNNFTAFTNLVSLQLSNFTTEDQTLESLISSCPILETLVLKDLCGSNCLDIDAPNLKYLRLEGEFKYLIVNTPNLTFFHLEGEFNYIRLENTPYLIHATFKMTVISAEYAAQGLPHYLVQPPGCLSPFETLTLSGYFLRCLDRRQIFPIACDHLKVLELFEVHFYNWDEISVALSILRSTSNLKELHLSVVGPFSEEVYEFVKIQDQFNCCFNQLRVVKIQILLEEEAEDWRRSDLELIKLVLACSPVLEKMLVNYKYAEDCDIWFMRELLLFHRASPQLIFKYVSTSCQ